jgi:type I restriction enzyme, S subunit
MSVFPKHKRYKDSGFEWLGEVPEHWDVQSLRAVAGLYVEKNQPDLPVLSVYREYGVILKDSRDDNHNATSLDTSNYKVVRPGDLAVNKMKAWQGSLGVSEHHGIVSPAYITCRLNQERVTGRYIHYLLRSKTLIGALDSISYGVRVGQWDMRFEDFKKVGITIPPKPEQDRIVAFLDQKTAEIDALIAKKQRQIELLDEQKAILVNRAVTRGLNPTAQLKPSGFEWIGDIPEQWEVLPFTKNVIDSSDYRGKTPEKVASGVDLVTAKNVRKGYIDYECSREFVREKEYVEIMRRGLPKIGDILFTTEAPLGNAALVDREDIALAQRIIRFRMDPDKFDSKFVLYSIISDHFQGQLIPLGTGSTAQGIKASRLPELKIISPPKPEQVEIGRFIQGVINCQEISVMSIRKVIQSLENLRGTLIAHAVTGRIKCP